VTNVSLLLFYYLKMRNKYNPKSVRAALIAKHLPDLYKTYKMCGTLSEVVKKVKSFGIDNLNISNPVERELVKSSVFDCSNSVLKEGIRYAYTGMPEIDSLKNVKILPNFEFEPIFPDFPDVMKKLSKKAFFDVCGYVGWSSDEIEFVRSWHSKKKLPKQIARGYQKFVSGGDFCDGTYEPFADRSESAVISFINHSYTDGTLKPFRINWEKQNDLAFAAHWISYLENRDVSYKGYIKRTASCLNDYFFSSEEKLGNRALECFLKRDSSVVKKVEFSGLENFLDN
jgi:hypothetical protein